MSVYPRKWDFYAGGGHHRTRDQDKRFGINVVFAGPLRVFSLKEDNQS